MNPNNPKFQDLINTNDPIILKEGMHTIIKTRDATSTMIDTIKESNPVEFIGIKSNLQALSPLNNLFLDGIQSSLGLFLSGIVVISASVIIYFYIIDRADLLEEEGRADGIGMDIASNEDEILNGSIDFYLQIIFRSVLVN